MGLLLSKSSISLYERCPLAWKYNYIDRLPRVEPKFFGRGKDLHEIFNDFFDDYHIDGGVVPNFAIPEEYEEDFNNFLKYENYRYATLRQQGKLEYYQPYMRERYVKNFSVGLHGIIDRVDKYGDQYTIIEYKTGRENTPGVLDELAFYTLILDISVQRWVILYTKIGKLVDIEVDKKLIEKAKGRAEKVREGIEAGDFSPANSLEDCYYCGFKAHCSELINFI